MSFSFLLFVLNLRALTITSSTEIIQKTPDHTFVQDISLSEEFIFIQDDTRRFRISADKKEALAPILEIIEKFAQPPSQLNNIAQDLDNIDNQDVEDENALLKQGNTSFAVFFNDDLSKFSAHEIAKYKNSLKIYLSDDKNLAEELNVSFPGVFGYASSDRVTYRLPFTSLNKECSIILTPILKELTVETLKMYDDTGLPKFFLFYAEDDPASFYNLERAYTDVVKKYRDILKLGILAYKKDKPTLQHFGINEHLLPCVVCVHDLKKYRLVNLTPDILQEGLENFKNNTLEGYEATGPEPEDNDTRSVKVLTRSNYKKYFWLNIADKTEENDKDAFVVFTSPHCRFCVELKPVLYSFAEMNLPNLVIGDADMTVNDFPEFEVKGYPTICLVSQGKVFYFNGGRGVNEFERFVAVNSLLGKSTDEEFDEEIDEGDNKENEEDDNEEYKKEENDEIEKNENDEIETEEFEEEIRDDL